MKQWVDVPGGWAYGWPKLYDPEKDGDFVEWIRSAGYKGSLEDVSGWYIVLKISASIICVNPFQIHFTIRNFTR